MLLFLRLQSELLRTFPFSFDNVKLVVLVARYDDVWCDYGVFMVGGEVLMDFDLLLLFFCFI